MAKKGIPNPMNEEVIRFIEGAKEEIPVRQPVVKVEDRVSLSKDQPGVHKERIDLRIDSPVLTMLDQHVNKLNELRAPGESKHRRNTVVQDIIEKYLNENSLL